MWQLRAVALGELQLLPEQYWRTTLAELTEMLRGATEREPRRWRRTAWLASHLINISGKSVPTPGVTPDQLLYGQRMSADSRKALDERVRAEREAGE